MQDHATEAYLSAQIDSTEDYIRSVGLDFKVAIMRTLLSIPIVLLSALMCAQPAAAESSGPPAKNILVLYGAPRQRDELLDQLRSGLRSHVAENFYLFEDFLESDPAVTDPYQESVAVALGRRFAKEKPDLIIVAGPSAFNFVIEYHDRIFPGVPILFTGLATSQYGARSWPGMTGLTVPVGLGETVALAFQLQPDTENVAVIASPEDPFWLAATRSEITRYGSKIREIDILDNSPPVILKKVAALPPHTIALVSRAYREYASRGFASSDLINAIAQRVPTYSAFRWLCINKGCIGGAYEDTAKETEWLTGAATRLLSGTKPEEIPIHQSVDIQAQVDWRAFKRWDLDDRRLSPGVILLNKPPTLWELYKNYVVVTLSVIFVQALLIAGLLLQRRMRREAENRLRAIFDSSQDAIITVDEQQSIVSFNQSAQRMFGYSAVEMIGQKLDRLTSEPAWAHHADLVTAVEKSNMTNRTMPAPTLALTWLHADGHVFPSEVSTSHTKVGGRRLLSAFVRDTTERNRGDMKLRDSEERFRATFEQAAIGIVHVSFEGRILRCNTRFAEILGYSPDEVVGMRIQQLTPPDYLSESNELLNEFEAGNLEEKGLEKPYIRKDMSVTWVRLTISIQRDGKGHPLHMVTFVEDITDRRSAEEHLAAASKELQASEIRHRTVFQTSLDALAISRLSDGKVVDVNKTFLDLMGLQRDEAIGRTTVELGLWTNPSERPAIVDELRRSSSIRDIEVLFRRKGGNTFWGLMSASVIEFEGVPHVFVVIRDLSEAKDAVKMIRDLAFYDPLTHLPNRRSLLDLLEQTNDAGPRMRALLFVDLDNFKSLNDAFGHRAGDLLLQEAAQRLAACVRGEGTAARLGGDEFAIALENVGNTSERAAEQAKQIGERVLAAGSLPYLVGERECHFSASIGITVFGADLKSGLEALQQSEIAMSQAKEAGRNTIRFFSPELQANVNARVLLENELHKAIKEEEFELYFQPQVRGGRLIGSEALIRWNHPHRGVLDPDVFVELAEDTGLILPLSNWVFGNACEHVAAWAGKNRSGDAPVAVNISGKQFSQPDFVGRVLATLDITGANPASIKLELTETSLVKDFQGAVAKMTELKSHGLKFSVDDFGTGYSSLAYLKSLPLDQLKIDRAFVKDILVDGPSGAIAQAIISMGHSMGFSVIAEGVETEEQRDFLVAIGCDCFQGYLYSRPVPADEFERIWFL
jgi:diguanylate cyclase (GGDEF)-like protein/PAS domain S-box-containing protein